MTERSRAFLAELEAEALLPPGTLAELMPGFAGDDPALDDIPAEDLARIAGLFARAIRAVGLRREDRFAPLTGPERRRLIAAVALVGRELAQRGPGVDDHSLRLIQQLCPYCPDAAGGAPVPERGGLVG